MNTQEDIFRADVDQADPSGVVWYTLVGERYGPFGSVWLALADLFERAESWNREAARFGGSVAVRWKTDVVVRVPAGAVGIHTVTSWLRQGKVAVLASAMAWIAMFANEVAMIG